MPYKLLIIGISGVTCGGKTTMACQLNKFLPKSKLLSQDDYFLDDDDPRHVWIPSLNHINYDILSSLDMAKMHNDIQAIIKKQQLINTCDRNINKKFETIRNFENFKVAVYDKIKNANVQILIVEGFSIFNYKPMRNLFHLKYYFTLTKEECYKRRIQRVYEPPDCPGYFEECAWPEHVKQLEEVRREMEGVKYFDGKSNSSFQEIVLDIESVIDSSKT